MSRKQGKENKIFLYPSPPPPTNTQHARLVLIVGHDLCSCRTGPGHLVMRHVPGRHACYARNHGNPCELRIMLHRLRKMRLQRF